MRSILRFLLTFFSSVVVASCILCIIFPSSPYGQGSDQGQETRNLGGWLSFRDPGFLFSATATISLTDDNSTFFNAKPAAFGPSLPNRGLSGQIWVGGGFEDDNVNRQGMTTTSEGELGCADVLGWKDGDWQVSRTQDRTSKVTLSESNRRGLGSAKARREDDSANLASTLSVNQSSVHIDNDGTDNHLHYPLSVTQLTRSSYRPARPSPGGGLSRHGNIHSLQETAEISGNIVLLSRGGCGFAEKVKWAQRRGAIGVIVADNVRGGPLVRMYARDDVSNITIPSIFTSHTTAHLLSHLIPPITKGESAKKDDAETVEEWDVDADASTTSAKSFQKVPSQSTDDFQIGVQDWRDPDVLRIVHGEEEAASSIVPTSESVLLASVPTSSGGLKGGSITPGSGEYQRPSDKLIDASSPHQTTTGNLESAALGRPWYKKLLGGTQQPDSKLVHKSKVLSSKATSTNGLWKDTLSFTDGQAGYPEDPDHHIGLWVTLTPTEMNASPFLNTLFVLVVSPLFTLAVVYTMLLLRSRIRLRRWRAPKSVVEQLPVRVYTAISSRSASEPATPQPEANVTTPLLSATRPQNIVGRRNTSETSEEGTSAPSCSSGYGSLGQASIDQEKIVNGLAQWKKKYGGRQRECVVCLEEYVDGVSRVMSLPCGHEFHAECITPWLTTRRRTCPICKGDVVRSMAQSSPAGGQHRQPDLSLENVQQQAAETNNTSLSASLPVPGGPSHPIDVERGGEDYASSYSNADSSPSSSATWLARNVERGLHYLGVQRHDRERGTTGDR